MQNIFKVNNRSTRRQAPGVSFFKDFYWLIYTYIFLHGILFSFKQNLSMCIRVETTSTAIFKMKLYQTVSNSLQPLPIFCHKELHLRCCIGPELNIVRWSIKFLKGISWQPPWSSATFGKYEKLSAVNALKLHLQRFFTLN